MYLACPHLSFQLSIFATSIKLHQSRNFICLINCCTPGTHTHSVNICEMNEWEILLLRSWEQFKFNTFQINFINSSFPTICFSSLCYLCPLSSSNLEIPQSPWTSFTPLAHCSATNCPDTTAYLSYSHTHPSPWHIPSMDPWHLPPEPAQSLLTWVSYLCFCFYSYCHLNDFSKLSISFCQPLVKTLNAFTSFTVFPKV